MRRPLVILWAAVASAAIVAAAAPAGQQFRYVGTYAITVLPIGPRSEPEIRRHRLSLDLTALPSGRVMALSVVTEEGSPSDAVSSAERFLGEIGEDVPVSRRPQTFLAAELLPRLEVSTEGQWYGPRGSLLADWPEVRLAHRVAGQADIEGRRCWVVESRPDAKLPLLARPMSYTQALQRTWVEIATGHVLRATASSQIEVGEGGERLIMRYSTRLDLEETKPIPKKRAKKLAKEADAALALADRFSAIRRARGSEEAIAAFDRTWKQYGKKHRKSAYYAAARQLRAQVDELKLFAAGQVEPAPNRLLNKPAPKIRLKTLDGKTVSLSDMKGKVVLLNFFASW